MFEKSINAMARINKTRSDVFVSGRVLMDRISITVTDLSTGKTFQRGFSDDDKAAAWITATI